MQHKFTRIPVRDQRQQLVIEFDALAEMIHGSLAGRTGPVGQSIEEIANLGLPFALLLLRGLVGLAIIAPDEREELRADVFAFGSVTPVHAFGFSLDFGWGDLLIRQRLQRR